MRARAGRRPCAISRAEPEQLMWVQLCHCVCGDENPPATHQTPKNVKSTHRDGNGVRDSYTFGRRRRRNPWTQLAPMGGRHRILCYIPLKGCRYDNEQSIHIVRRTLQPTLRVQEDAAERLLLESVRGHSAHSMQLLVELPRTGPHALERRGLDQAILGEQEDAHYSHQLHCQ